MKKQKIPAIFPSVFKSFVLVLFFVFLSISTSKAEDTTSKNKEEKQSEITLPLGQGPIIELVIHGSINPVSADYIQKGLEYAKEKNSRALLLRLNTPGGLLPSMQQIVEEFLDSPVPVIVYVSPSGGGAISAGVFITLAGHVAAMAPGTTIGAAHPVQAGGQDMGDDMRGKVENFAASMVKAIAEQRGRNVEWAEKAVRESVALTDTEALKQGVIDLVSPTVESLLESIEGRVCKVPYGQITLKDLKNHPIELYEMSFQQKIINTISDPNIAALLGLGAAGGILAEFYNPGLIVPGLVGVICLILTLVAVQVIPINAGGIVLLVLGTVLMMAELFIPSFGILGIAGVICLVLGSIYAVDTSMVWAVDGFSFDRLLVGGVAAGFGAFLLLILYLAVNAKSRRVTTGEEGMIGMKATVSRAFVKKEEGSGILSGKAKLMGEIWNADLIEGDLPLAVGESVKVVEVEGLRLKVVRG